jgi:hypothetical protein
MSSYIYILIILAGLGGLVLFMQRQSSGSKPSAVKPKPKPRPTARPTEKPATGSKNYRAASLQIKATSCAAAKKIAGKRLLTNEIPAIPLKNCDRMTECACTFRKHEDRRRSDDRRSHSFAVARMSYAEKQAADRRDISDRRRTPEDGLDLFEFK